MYKHMLVDSRNIIYRAVYTSMDDDKKVHPVMLFFRFLMSYMRKYKSESVHLFWDEERDKVWRKNIFEDYKGGRDKSYKHDKEEVKRIVEESTEAIKEISKLLNCRSYERAKQEADDLIYAFCHEKVNERIIIISADADMMQIPFKFRNVDVFSPNSGKICEMPEVSPVEMKCISGEMSDNIDGYYRIGPVNAKKIIQDDSKRSKLFKERGSSKYFRNRVLIDLSLSPHLFKNVIYISEASLQDIKYNEKEMYNTIQRYKVRGLASEFTTGLVRFKGLK